MIKSKLTIYVCIKHDQSFQDNNGENTNEGDDDNNFKLKLKI